MHCLGEGGRIEVQNLHSIAWRRREEHIDTHTHTRYTRWSDIALPIDPTITHEESQTSMQSFPPCSDLFATATVRFFHVSTTLTTPLRESSPSKASPTFSQCALQPPSTTLRPKTRTYRNFRIWWSLPPQSHNAFLSSVASRPTYYHNPTPDKHLSTSILLVFLLASSFLRRTPSVGEVRTKGR